MIVAALALAAQIDRIARDALRESPAAGMSIAVMRGEDVLLAKGYGYSNIELQAPATAKTVYHVDSITKHLTAGAILRLVDQQTISLADPVTNYLPELPPGWAKVTIRQLLNHTSGIASFTSLPSWGPQERLDMSHEDVLSLIRDGPFDFEPGSAWRYDNTGFYLLGMVIEKVTNKSYADAMNDLVFAPLKMSSSVYCGFRPLIANRAAGYEVDHGKLVNAEPMSWAAPFAGGAICSTILDLARYERALERNALFNAALLREMRAPTPLPDGAIDYGLGTRLGKLAGHRVVGHTGSGGGFRNVLVRYPDDDLTIVVLSNTDRGRTSIASVAVRIAKLILSVPDKPLVELPVPPGEIGKYVGRFMSDEDTIETAAMGTGIGFRPSPTRGLIPLHFIGGDTFAVTPDITVRFTVVDGKATWAQSYVGGMFSDAGRRIP